MGEKPAPSLAGAIKPSERGDGDGRNSGEEEKVFEFFICGVHEGPQVICQFAQEGGEVEKGVEYSGYRVVVHQD